MGSPLCDREGARSSKPAPHQCLSMAPIPQGTERDGQGALDSSQLDPARPQRPAVHILISHITASEVGYTPLKQHGCPDLQPTPLGFRVNKSHGLQLSHPRAHTGSGEWGSISSGFIFHPTTSAALTFT